MKLHVTIVAKNRWLSLIYLHLQTQTVKIKYSFLDSEVLDKTMTSNEKFDFATQPTTGATTIDLQGVASFASLVETLAQELGTTAGKIQGMLPQGSNFEQLVGEITVNNQGFNRTVTLYTAPGQPLKMRIFTALVSDRATITGIESQIILGATVDKIVPQARALARHLEEAFAVLDRMATLGQSSRLAAMSISETELAKFEQQEAASLVTSHVPRSTASQQQ
ncbi:MAG: hypothetical protein K2X77_00785 [Candidatus Obscuribacterales bacterium]|nr:hypothetical protein [Candidatus Obscuribacterales bacterium]